MVGQIVEGFWTDPFGDNSGHAFRHPAVHVTVSPTNSFGAAVPLVGMLDTGADLCRIDQGLTGNLTSGDTMSSFLSGIPMATQMYHAVIRLLGTDYSITGQFSEGPFRASGMKYDLLLGMDFLRSFDLSLGTQGGPIRLIQRV